MLAMVTVKGKNVFPSEQLWIALNIGKLLNSQVGF